MADDDKLTIEKVSHIYIEFDKDYRTGVNL